MSCADYQPEQSWPTRPTGIYGSGAKPPHAGILTFDGRTVGPGAGTPSLRDIAVGLSRLPRFGAQGRSWWSVLGHSIHANNIAKRIAEGRGYDEHRTRALRLAALMHDAHEAMTADVPTPFKTSGLRLDQMSLDRRIMESYFPGGYLGYEAFLVDVHEIDRRALLAEALVFGPPSLMTPDMVAERFGARPLDEDVTALRDLTRKALIPTDPSNLRLGSKAPEVSLFLNRYLALR